MDPDESQIPILPRTPGRDAALELLSSKDILVKLIIHIDDASSRRQRMHETFANSIREIHTQADADVERICQDRRGAAQHEHEVGIGIEAMPMSTSLYLHSYILRSHPHGEQASSRTRLSGSSKARDVNDCLQQLQQKLKRDEQSIHDTASAGIDALRAEFGQNCSNLLERGPSQVRLDLCTATCLLSNSQQSIDLPARTYRGYASKNYTSGSSFEEGPYSPDKQRSPPLDGTTPTPKRVSRDVPLRVTQGAVTGAESKGSETDQKHPLVVKNRDGVWVGIRCTECTPAATACKTRGSEQPAFFKEAAGVLKYPTLSHGREGGWSKDLLFERCTHKRLNKEEVTAVNAYGEEGYHGLSILLFLSSSG